MGSQLLHPVSVTREPDHDPQLPQAPDEAVPGGKDDGVGLTEVEASPPAGHDRRLHALEDREQQAKGDCTRSKSHDRERELAEVAAPAPAPVDEYRPSDEEAALHSPANTEDLGEKQRKEPVKEKRRSHSRAATELYTVSWLVFFSLLGTLARLGVEAVTLYPNTPFPSRVLWANLGGSFFMGFLSEDRQLFREEWGAPDPKAPASNHGKVKKTIPLFIGLATGLCGSFTSFSSFMRDSFLALTNDLQGASPTSPYHVDLDIHRRSGGFSFLALLAILILHPAVSITALQTGAQTALVLQPVTPTIPSRFTRKFLDPLGVLLGFGGWFGAILLSIFPPGNGVNWRFRATLPLVLAPPGCLLRFYASKHLNSRIPSFPLGTFVVNIFGTAILGMAWDLQHARTVGAAPDGSPNVCSILQGLMEGFCGCLTTVSTWVLELQGLRRRHAWIYGFVSIGVGVSLMIMIMGAMGWTVGFANPACS